MTEARTTDIVEADTGDVVLGSAIALHAVTPPSRRHRPSAGAWLRRRWWRAGGAVVLALVAVLVLDSLLGGVVYRARQGQLVADYRTPRNFTATGRALAVLQVPKLDMDIIVAEGVDPGTLRGSPGHLPSSVVPGAAGNSVIYGHRSRFGGPFGDLGSLAVGDELYVQAKGSQDVVRYRVVSTTTGSESEVLPSLTPSDEVALTLVTNAGSRLGRDRLVVRATAESAARRTPAPTSATAAPDAVEPPGDVVNLSLLFAVGWAVLAAAIVRGLRALYATRVRWLVAMLPIALSACLFWYEIDRWLPATS